MCMPGRTLMILGMRTVVMGMMTPLTRRVSRLGGPSPGRPGPIAFVEDLKAQPGGDIHLAGGARLAQTMVRLGLVDQYHFVVHPIVSPGASWFDQIEEQRGMTLGSATAYSNGVVGLYYNPRGT